MTIIGNHGWLSLGDVFWTDDIFAKVGMNDEKELKIKYSEEVALPE